jgi:hypothetical protein
MWWSIADFPVGEVGVEVKLAFLVGFLSRDSSLHFSLRSQTSMRAAMTLSRANRKVI